MTKFLIYIIESAISLSLFYIFYELFLKRDTWFKFNRYFLLFSLVFSFSIPLLDFSVSSAMVNSQNQFEFTEIVDFGSTIETVKTNVISSVSNPNYILLFYLLVVSLFSIRLIHQFIIIIKTVNANEIINYKSYKLVLINNSSSPFSFFNYVFINKDDYGSIGSEELLLHEITHAKQKHSIDVIFLEIILVLQWFNPFIYRYRQAFKEIHEYLADKGVLKANFNRYAYQKLILDQIEKSLNVSLASQFNYSLTKNRIKMMTRIKSGNISKFKILFVLPLIAILLMAFTIDFSYNKGPENQNQVQIQEQNQSENIPSIFPVKKVDGVKISSGYGMRMHPIKKKKMMHNAVDIKAPEGTPVYATANGLIRKVNQTWKQGKGYGMYIIVDHENGYSTMYTQLSKYNVKESQKVKQGDIIGYVGSTGISTGPHLHYEVMKDGENVDPEKYF